MSLRRGQIVTLAASFGAVFLTFVGHIGIREWYQPYVRYEEGAYYITGDLAITSLRITNAGHSDAEEIVISTRFASLVRDYSLNVPGLRFARTSGGLGERRVTGTVGRLVPGQTATIYFAVEHSDSPGDEHRLDFLESITFKGGQGKTGEPVWALGTLGVILITVVYGLGLLAFIAYQRSLRESHYEKISWMISAAQRAKQSGQSRDELEAQVEGELQSVKYRRKTLKEVALRTFDA